MSIEYVLETRHLKRYFGKVHAVEDISLQVSRGEIFGFLGPNGAGKTTTISMILGLTIPSAGEVEVLGERVTPLSNRVLRRVGTMVGGGGPSLMLPFTARQHLRCMAYLRPDLPMKRIDDVLERVGLSKTAADRPARTYSTGMKQRLGLALALVNQPELLVLDEPSNGVDPAGMHEIRLLLRSLVQEGMTIFISSHLLHEMEQMCDRVAVVQRGRVIKQGTVAELLHKEDVVRVHTHNPESTAQVLKQLAGVQETKVYDDTVDVRGSTSESIMTFLVQHSIIPKEISTIHPDLESVFLELTQ
jgi:ABC-2 type transport system ATP-binding protein